MVLPKTIPSWSMKSMPISRRQVLQSVRKHLPSAVVVTRIHPDRRLVSRAQRKLQDRALAFDS
jgi:hypothetical protein